MPDRNLLVASRDARRSEVQYINGVCKWPRREGASSTDKNIYAPLLSASTPFSGQECVGGTWARSRAREYALLAFGVGVGQRTVHPMMRFHSFIDRLVSVVRQSKQREIKRGGTAQREK